MLTAQGMTPLMNAAKHCNFEIVKMLVEHKANVDHVSQTNVSSLSLKSEEAIFLCHLVLVHL